MLPDLPNFPSRPTPDGRGRVYDVHGSTRLVAYWIDDRETLAPAATAGFFVFAFLDQKRVGYWSWGTTPAELERAMVAYRDAHGADAPRPVPLAPGGEPAMIQPQSSVLIEAALEPRGLEPSRLEGER